MLDTHDDRMVSNAPTVDVRTEWQRAADALAEAVDGRLCGNRLPVEEERRRLKRYWTAKTAVEGPPPKDAGDA